NLAAEADALDEAAPEKLVVIGGEGAGEAHQRVKRDGKPRRAGPADALGRPAEDERAQGLAEIGDRDEPANALRRNVPVAHDDRQHVSDREGVETVEEDRDAEERRHRDMPARIRQTLQTRGDGLLVERQGFGHDLPPFAECLVSRAPVFTRVLWPALCPQARPWDRAFARGAALARVAPMGN